MSQLRAQVQVPSGRHLCSNSNHNSNATAGAAMPTNTGRNGGFNGDSRCTNCNEYVKGIYIIPAGAAMPRDIRARQGGRGLFVPCPNCNEYVNKRYIRYILSAWPVYGRGRVGGNTNTVRDGSNVPVDNFANSGWSDADVPSGWATAGFGTGFSVAELPAVTIVSAATEDTGVNVTVDAVIPEEVNSNDRFVYTPSAFAQRVNQILEQLF
ncbi:hypothetical protein GPALN_011959 [Globodera pallida]|nr:hypothetical protein GPALN_011959 [Globodera pallida]